ncbi:MAG: serine/threonine protein kinase [Pseudomonadota bacterium]
MGSASSTENALGSFDKLNPDLILDAVEATGRAVNGRLLALNSYENRVYQVGIEDERPVVAKFYRPNRWTTDAIVEEHVFTHELAAVEIPVIAPLSDPSGNTVFEHGGFRFALFPSVGGRAPQLDNVDELEQLGRLLGRIHNIGALHPFQHRVAIDPKRLGFDAAEYVLSQDLLPDDLRESYAAITRDVLEKVRQKFSESSPFEVIRLHGDSHVGNVLVQGEQFALVDFDDTCNGPRIQDLWMLLSGERDYRQARLGDVLTGYLEFAEFDPRELHLVEALRALRQINYAAWLSLRHREPAFVAAFPWFRERNYWDRHILALREQSAALDEPDLIWD